MLARGLGRDAIGEHQPCSGYGGSGSCQPFSGLVLQPRGFCIGFDACGGDISGQKKYRAATAILYQRLRAVSSSALAATQSDPSEVFSFFQKGARDLR